MFLCNPVGAAEFSVNRGSDDQTAIIFVDGEIEPGDEQQFRDISLQLRTALVVLDSNGGALLPALEIGKILRVAGYDTAVLEEGVCASSCALIWLAGGRRRVSDGGRVGFHAAYRNNQGKPEEVGAANALIGGYLTSLGLSTRAILFATTAPPDRILWLTDVDVTVSGIDYVRTVSPPRVQTLPAPVGTPTSPIIQLGPSVGPTTPSSRDLISSLSRSGEKWTKLQGFRNAYYDRNSMINRNSARKVWILYDYTDDIGGASPYELKLTEVHCKKGQLRINRIVSKDRDRAGPNRFSEPAPGSTERAILVGLCSIR